jgi:hypothetical protein
MKLVNLFESSQKVISCTLDGGSIDSTSIENFFSVWHPEFASNTSFPLVCNQQKAPSILTGQIACLIDTLWFCSGKLVKYYPPSECSFKDIVYIEIDGLAEALDYMRVHTAMNSDAFTINSGAPRSPLRNFVVEGIKEVGYVDQEYLATLLAAEKYVKEHFNDSDAYDALEDGFSHAVKLFPSLREHGMTPQEFYGSVSVGGWRKNFLDRIKTFIPYAITTTIINDQSQK